MPLWRWGLGERQLEMHLIKLLGSKTEQWGFKVMNMKLFWLSVKSILRIHLEMAVVEEIEGAERASWKFPLFLTHLVTLFWCPSSRPLFFHLWVIISELCTWNTVGHVMNEWVKDCMVGVVIQALNLSEYWQGTGENEHRTLCKCEWWRAPSPIQVGKSSFTKMHWKPVILYPHVWMLMASLNWLDSWPKSQPFSL